jgi:hypothetical protein
MGVRRWGRRSKDTAPSWIDAGEIVICPRGWPQFPKVAKLPGLYRITLSDGRIYIGEAGDLKRRLHEYRRPTDGTEGEHVIHHALVEAKGGRLEISTDPRWAVRSVRRQFERDAIQLASTSGHRLLNETGKDQAKRLAGRIAYH